MFFEQDDISLNITNILKLEWDKRNEQSSNRPFHALSFRICGNADIFVSDNKKMTIFTNIHANYRQLFRK